MNSEELKERVEEHSNRIEELEKQSIKASAKIDNLCEKLDNLTTSLNKQINMFTTVFFTSLMALIVFLIERHI